MLPEWWVIDLRDVDSKDPPEFGYAVTNYNYETRIGLFWTYQDAKLVADALNAQDGE
jgi:hypothetical protein